jgi:DNA-binding CsgD family transcriptional regulator
MGSVGFPCLSCWLLFLSPGFGLELLQPGIGSLSRTDVTFLPLSRPYYLLIRMTDPGTRAEVGTGLSAPAHHDDREAVDGPLIDFSGTAAPTVVVLLIATCIVTDLVSDIRARQPLDHMIGMIVGTMLSFLCLVMMWRLVRASRAQARALSVALDSTRADLVEWRSKAAETLQGLGALIDRQFDAWVLSPAEREVGLLLLKGLSLKDIAEARQTNESTARQQALALYRKAGLAGRAELSAFFLEDLLLPPSPAAAGAPQRRPPVVQLG